MSLLHRALLSAAFKEMLQKFEPIVQDTLETAVAVVAPAAAPVIDAGLELAAEATGLKPTAGATTADHVAAAVAAASASPAGAVSPTPPAAPAAANASAAAATTPAAAALAACDAISMTLAQFATQVAAIRANVTGSSAS